MNAGLESGSPPMTVAGGWQCESIEFVPQSQPDEDGIARKPALVDLWTPADADAVVDAQIQQGNEEDPFWCYLWPTARTLSQQVFRATQAFMAYPLTDESSQLNPSSSLRVLETGCGIGLVGLAALAAGATAMTFQDLRSRSVDLALHNARVNGFGDRALGETFDWRSPPDSTFDWIVASDVLYHAPLHEPLLNFLLKAITPNQGSFAMSVAPPPPASLPLSQIATKGSIWIGDPGRREAARFIQLAQSHFQVALFDGNGLPLSVPNHGTYQLIVLGAKC